MNRIELIQEIFKKTPFKNYLEIGCYSGVSFLPIKAKNKIAVDPSFKIAFKYKLKWLLKEPRNFNNKYFEETSELFFSKRKAFLERIGALDVILIDGLHTFQNSLNDVLNSLEYLNNNGIIILHDCFPPHKAAALPTKTYPSIEEQESVEGWTDDWCGDVWKTIVYLRKNLGELLNICVLNTDYGLGLIRPKSKVVINNLVVNEKSFSEIDKLTYDELIQDPESLVNLKETDYASTITNEIILAQ